MAGSTEYILGGTATERDRLLLQSQDFGQEAAWLLDRLDVRAGWRALDVGCGPIGILDLLSQRVGHDGEVFGLERESRFIEMGEDIIAERQLSNVRLVKGDVFAHALPKNSFDLVHERLVLILQADPGRMLAEMVELARPGGVVVLEDIDDVSWLCYPPHEAWSVLLEALQTVFREGRVDVFIGRRLAELLRLAGLLEVEVEVHARLARVGEYRRGHLLSLVDSVKEKLLARGLFSASELASLVDSLQEHLSDRNTVVIRQLLFQAWGRKPGG